MSKGEELNFHLNCWWKFLSNTSKGKGSL